MAIVVVTTCLLDVAASAALFSPTPAAARPRPLPLKPPTAPPARRDVFALLERLPEWTATLQRHTTAATHAARKTLFLSLGDCLQMLVGSVIALLSAATPVELSTEAQWLQFMSAAGESGVTRWEGQGGKDSGGQVMRYGGCLEHHVLTPSKVGTCTHRPLHPPPLQCCIWK